MKKIAQIFLLICFIFILFLNKSCRNKEIKTKFNLEEQDNDDTRGAFFDQPLYVCPEEHKLLKEKFFKNLRPFFNHRGDVSSFIIDNKINGFPYEISCFMHLESITFNNSFESLKNLDYSLVLKQLKISPLIQNTFVLKENFSTYQNLTFLQLDNLQSIQSVFSTHLKTLEINSLQNENLPESISKITELKNLKISNSLITDLHAINDELQDLEVLEIIFCALITQVPENWKNLKKLKKLDLRLNANLHNLPDGFGEFKQEIEILLTKKFFDQTEQNKINNWSVKKPNIKITWQEG